MSIRTRGMVAAAALVLAVSIGGATATPPSDPIQSALNNAFATTVKAKGGKNADYIPALARVDSRIFGIVVVTVDGKIYTVGDIKSEVSIQSISKVFTLALVMQQLGPDSI